MSLIASKIEKRHSFSRIQSIQKMPDLLDVQLRSFKHFMQLNVPVSKREAFGLQEVFLNAFPLEDTHRNYILEYKSYYYGKPKYSPSECLDRGVTFNVPLKVKLTLHITDEFDRSKYAHSIDQDVYFGNVSLTGQSA